MVDFDSECVNLMGQPWSILTVNVLRFQVLMAVNMKLRGFVLFEVRTGFLNNI
jgi:hypothetical protein